MPELSRIRVVWDKWPGGPGVSTFYVTGTDYAALTPLHAFFENFKTAMPVGVTVTVPSQGDIIDEASGALTGQWQHGTDQVTTGTATGSWASGAGLLVRWHTAQIHNGRRLQGRTFLVPLVNACFGTNGQVDPTVLSQIQTAANTLISSSTNELAVWGRPKVGMGGLHGQITDAVVSSKPVFLRSRRD